MVLGNEQYPTHHSANRDLSQRQICVSRVQSELEIPGAPEDFVSKMYTAGLEMGRPGGACLKLGRDNSQSRQPCNHGAKSRIALGAAATAVDRLVRRGLSGRGGAHNRRLTPGVYIGDRSSGGRVNEQSRSCVGPQLRLFVWEQRGLAMPEEQSHAYIEATNEVDSALGRLDRLIQETQEIERCLADEERKRGITPDRSKPITERMAAFGASQEIIDSVAERLEAMASRFNS